jgi:hypothetical protein
LKELQGTTFSKAMDLIVVTNFFNAMDTHEAKLLPNYNLKKEWVIVKNIMTKNFKAATFKPLVNVYVSKSDLKITNVSIFELGVNDFMKIIKASFIELHHEMLLEKMNEMQNNNSNIICIISLTIKLNFLSENEKSFIIKVVIIIINVLCRCM